MRSEISALFKSSDVHFNTAVCYIREPEIYFHQLEAAEIQTTDLELQTVIT